MMMMLSTRAVAGAGAQRCCAAVPHRCVATRMEGDASETSAMLDRWTSHAQLKDWVQRTVALCGPSRVHLCDGSQEEFDEMCHSMVASGTAVKLSDDKRPGSYLACSNPKDVARMEKRTFICSETKDDAGPTNNWESPATMHKKLDNLYQNSMRGRTLYAIPFCMGPLGSDISYNGVEITDSPYVVANMKIMTRMGSKVLEQLGSNQPFVPCLHSSGMPLGPGKQDVAWPCNPDNAYITQFPGSHSIQSFGSGYGGNALLGKKCFALRIASVLAREQGWLAEHMLILGLTNPEGKKIYVAAAFPSMCGKTNLAMIQSHMPGWKVETVGDDIAWMKFGQDGRLYAVNPEAGFFGVAPGTSMKSNPNAMLSLRANTIFTNVAMTADGDVWWEGMTDKPPKHMTTWQKQQWQPGMQAAHKNSRFTAPASQCPCIDPAWEDPKGVPISAILFGGRRESLVPLVFQSFDWSHGTFLGTAVSSEATAAAVDPLDKIRHDPFAMLPFCGYNMADYFQHWLDIGKNAPNKAFLPKIFHVNWFRKGENGKFMWPGYSDNMRVLKWVFDRVTRPYVADNAARTPIGWVPTSSALDLNGLESAGHMMPQLLNVNRPAWLGEVDNLRTYYDRTFGDRLPLGIRDQLNNLERRLKSDA
eukprot:TRINITY_DN8197_c0_g1_i1.p1 TRINITY_DN8197_c0_g1~~TRINITY_DN8197_c0_g1_i1.p1  ORF type:complete len:686 (-),score=146.84 TRINITY_DN8197_c0_g1_i1:154-2088(-)